MITNIFHKLCTKRVITLLIIFLLVSSTFALAQVYIGTGYYPRFVSLSNGTVLVAVDATEGSYRVIKIYRSDQYMQNWYYHGEVTRRLSSEYDVANPQLIVLKNPEEVFVAFRVINQRNDEAWIDICKSTNGGSYWTWVSQLDYENAPGDLYEPFLLALGPNQDHEIFAVYTSEVDIYGNSILPDQVLLGRRSLNRGQSWGSKIYVTNRQSGHRDGMPTLVDIGAGQFIVYYEKLLNGAWSIRSVKSNNAGYSWVEADRLIFQYNYCSAPSATLVYYPGQRFIRLVFQYQNVSPPYLYRIDLTDNWQNTITSQGPLYTRGWWPGIFQSLNGTIIVGWGINGYVYGNLY